MKKILFIANLYHAAPRIPLLSKYLRKIGYETFIITNVIDTQSTHMGLSSVNLKEEINIIETKENKSRNDLTETIKRKYNIKSKSWYPLVKPILKVLSRIYHEIKYFPDSEINWKSAPIQKFEELFEKEDIHVIISSSSPVTCHIVASEIKRKYNVPWIADLRDLWSQNHNYQYSKIRKYFERRLELNTLKTADALVTVTPIWSEKLTELHRRNNVFSITNGFDPDMLKDSITKKSFKFSITYTGQIYPGKQDVTIVLDTIKELIADAVINPEKISVDFYGKKSRQLDEAIRIRSLQYIVNQHGIIPWDTVHKKQMESHVLLLFYWNDKNERGWIPSKVFEYFTAKKPIIATGGNQGNIIEQILKSTNSGYFCPTVNETKDVLRKLYLQFINDDSVRYAANVDEINRFSWDNLANKYAALIEKVVQGKK